MIYRRIDFYTELLQTICHSEKEITNRRYRDGDLEVGPFCEHYNVIQVLYQIVSEQLNIEYLDQFS